MKPKLILQVVSLLTAVAGALPLLKQYTAVIPASIPTSGAVYSGVLVVIGIAGIVLSLNRRTF